MRIRRTARGLSARLAAIALLPALGLLAFGGVTTSNRWHRAHGAAEASADLELLNDLMQLRLRLIFEQIPLRIVTDAAEYGFTTARAEMVFGFSFDDRVATARDETDGFVEQIGQRTDFTAETERLATLRAGIDAHDVNERDLRQGFQTLSSDVSHLAAEQLNKTRTAFTAIRGSQDLELAMSNLTQTYRLVEAAGQELPLLFDTYSSAFTNGSSETARSKLSQLSGWYLIAAEDLQATLSPTALASWALLRDDPNTQVFDKEVAAISVERPTSLELSDLGHLVSVATSGIERISLHLRVFDAVSADASAQIEAVKISATSDFVHSTLYIALFLVATLVMLFAVARSVLRPLQRLTRTAVGMSNGVLPTEKRTWRGPAEMQIVGGAFDSLVASLRVFDAQALALAQGRLDDPELQVELPGRLASSIHDTVQQLSQSMTARDDLHTRLIYEATHDNLTGIANRAAAMFALETMVIRRRSIGWMGAVLFIDLDDFKRANDAHGHQVGDAVLIEMARRLTGLDLIDGFVARLGGDEFLVISHGASQHEIEQLGEKIIGILSEQIEIRGRCVRVGASIGVALATAEETTSAELLRSADLAVYRAKALGRSRVVVFDEAMRREVGKRVEMEAALGLAIEREELHYELQPVWNPVNRQITGFEALVRWTTPEGRVVTPDEFIPLAESSGLVDLIDNYVMCRAMREIASWGDFTCREAHLAVNISGRHLLSREVVHDVQAALEQTGLEPHRLVLEITETVLVSDMVVACDHLFALRELGVRIAIDDFGSGYTSLGQLRLLPVDILKIDRAFITSLGTDSDDRLVRVLIEAAHGLDLSVVAEGVETMAQLQLLREMTCDAVQGHLLGAALAPADARNRLRLNRAEATMTNLAS